MARLTLHYYIDLPIDQALEVREELEPTVWEIAREENAEEILRDADFRVIVGQPAIEVGTVITVVVTYIGMKIIDKSVDEAIGWALDKAIETTTDLWTRVILPKVRERLGWNALSDDGEDEGG